MLRLLEALCWGIHEYGWPLGWWYGLGEFDYVPD